MITGVVLYQGYVMYNNNANRCNNINNGECCSNN